MEPIFKGELYPYQRDVCAWMKKREGESRADNHGIKGGLICLKMGLGKTLIAIKHSIDNAKGTPTLIITSKTLMYEWKREGFEKFFDNLKVLYFHRDFNTGLDHLTTADILEHHFVLSTYEFIMSVCKKYDYYKSVVIPHGSIRERAMPKNTTLTGIRNIYTIPWNRLILDESARIANPSTSTFKAVMAIPSAHTWCLTGTPIRNRDTDMWSGLRVCGYNDIIDPKLWDRYVFNSSRLERYIYEEDYESAEVVLPELIEHSYTVEMNDVQYGIYETMLLQVQNMYEQMLRKNVSYACVLAMFLRLRQVCIAPFLINAKTTRGYSILNDPLGPAGIDSPKIRKIISIISNVPKGEKIIVFSMFVEVLHLIQRAIEIDCPNDEYAVLTGSIKGSSRETMLTAFKDGSTRILLVHYKVGGEGLNLVQANHVICVEPWWSPTVQAQAVTRCWRRGQTKPVHKYTITTKASIEEPIINMCKNKSNLGDFYLKGSEYTPMEVGLTKVAMGKLLEQPNALF